MNKLNKKIVIAVSLNLIFGLSSFSKNINHSHNPQKAVKTTSKGSLRAILSPKQSSYPKMKPVKFTLNLSDKNKPVEKAIISMDLTMSGMYMPKNEITFKEVSKGVYESDAMFTMSGNWKLITSIINGNKKEVINFDINVD